MLINQLKLKTVAFFMPFFILFFMNSIDSTLLANGLSERGFLDDYPALWVLLYGVPVLSRLNRNYSTLLREILQSTCPALMLQISSFKMKILLASAKVFTLLLSLKINSIWICSQLNNNVFNWSTLNGVIKPLIFQTTEAFNLQGLIYAFVCLYFWYLFLWIAWQFIVSVILFILKNQSSTVVKTFFNCTSTFVFSLTFYYISLGFNDVVIEGFDTFHLHPDRFALLAVSLVFLLVYYMITTVLINRNNTNNSADEKQQQKPLFLYNVMLPIFAFTCYFFILNFVFKGQSYEVKLGFSFGVFSILTPIIAWSIYSSYTQSVILDHTQNQNTILENYANSMDQLYNESKCYRHDLYNMLLGFKSLIDDKNMDGITTYYDELINTTPGNNSGYKLLSDLSMIKIPQLKGSLLMKLGNLDQSKINLKLEVIDFHNDLHLSTATLTRTVGILIDNAIEAAMTTDQKDLLITFTIKDKASVITIGNRYEGITDIEKMMSPDYSTKGAHRGIGLHSLNKLLSKEASVSLNTSVDKEWFVQELRID